MSKRENEDFTYLVNCITKAREILEECSSEPEFVHFKNFPKGCCRVTCETLGNWLKENGVENVRYIWGTKDSNYHAWLQVNDKILDITADQFSGNYPKVIFTDKTKFHNQFSDLKEQNIEYNPSLQKIYSFFRKKMNLFSILSEGNEN